MVEWEDSSMFTASSYIMILKMYRLTQNMYIFFQLVYELNCISGCNSSIFTRINVMQRKVKLLLFNHLFIFLLKTIQAFRKRL